MCFWEIHVCFLTQVCFQFICFKLRYWTDRNTKARLLWFSWKLSWWHFGDFDFSNLLFLQRAVWYYELLLLIIIIIIMLVCEDTRESFCLLCIMKCWRHYYVVTSWAVDSLKAVLGKSFTHSRRFLLKMPHSFFFSSINLRKDKSDEPTILLWPYVKQWIHSNNSRVEGNTESPAMLSGILPNQALL